MTTAPAALAAGVAALLRTVIVTLPVLPTSKAQRAASPVMLSRVHVPNWGVEIAVTVAV